MLACTEAAAKHIRRQLEKRERGFGVRIGTKNSGCSGLAYTLEFCDAYDDESEQVFDSCGVKLVVRKKDLPFVDGTMLDFVRKGMNEGFEFKNPRETARCGCGQSFAV